MEHEEPKTNAVNEALKLPDGKAFEEELNAALIKEEPIVLAMTDIDRFMRINKTYGRDEGDRVLIETGRYLASQLPKDVRLFRYGGDEFAILFPGDWEKEDVLLLMDKIRTSYAVALKDPEDTLTISSGIAGYPEDTTRMDELVRKAEGAMIRGKMQGRNRVCLAREEKMVVKTTHYTVDQLHRLTKLSKREGTSEAILLREALDSLLKKYDV